MPYLNKVFLMGNLTRVPELRRIPGSDSAVCKFGIAINRRFAQADGRERDETCFLEIVVWGRQGETCARFLQKGASVFIEGRLVCEQWTERDTQKKRSRIRVNADRVQFLNARRDGGGAAPAPCGVVPSPSGSPDAGRRPYGLFSGSSERREDAMEARRMASGARSAEAEASPLANEDDIPF